MQRIDSNYSYYLWKDSIMASVGWERVHEHCHTITAAKGWCHDMTAQAALVMAPLMPCVGVGNMGGFKGGEQNRETCRSPCSAPPPLWWGFIKILNKKRPNKRQAEKFTIRWVAWLIDKRLIQSIDWDGRNELQNRNGDSTMKYRYDYVSR